MRAGSGWRMRSLHTLLARRPRRALAAPAAGAHVLHTVAAGETLWSIAAQSNLTTRTVAVYNGLSPDANVVLGSTLKIPSVAEGAAALAATGIGPAPAAAAAGTRARRARLAASPSHRDRRRDARGRAAAAGRLRRARRRHASAASPRRRAWASRRWRR